MPPALRPVLDLPENMQIIHHHLHHPHRLHHPHHPHHLHYDHDLVNYLRICHGPVLSAGLLMLSQFVREESPCDTTR